MIYFSDFSTAEVTGFFLGSKVEEQHSSPSDSLVSLTDIKNASDANVSLQEGDLIVAFHAQSSGGGTAQDVFKDDMKDPSYSDAMTEAVGYYTTNPDVTIFVSYKFMGSTPDTTMTFKGPEDTVNAACVVIMAFRGAHATPFEATYSTATGLSTATDPPAITPATSGCIILVMGAASDNVATAPTLPGDLSSGTNKFRTVLSPETNDCVLAVGMKEDWTSGSFDPTSWGNMGTSAPWPWAAATLVLKPA